MKNTRRRDTTIEVALRRLLHAYGLRYRIDQKILRNSRRRADIVFSRPRVAVFVDGCFWHCCPLHRTFPKANAEWWATKLRTNQRRDKDTDRKLTAAGWRVERVWGHEHPAEAAVRIAAIVRARVRKIFGETGSVNRASRSSILRIRRRSPRKGLRN
jgi:DNA mismatch endonuclease (patch repair protein)